MDKDFKFTRQELAYIMVIIQNKRNDCVDELYGLNIMECKELDEVETVKDIIQEGHNTIYKCNTILSKIEYMLNRGVCNE